MDPKDARARDPHGWHQQEEAARRARRTEVAILGAWRMIIRAGFAYWAYIVAAETKARLAALLSLTVK